jgi:5S rRNA maturation endonuclease (ribonuclease M5)
MVIEDKKKKMQKYMEDITLKAMATYEERFQNHLLRLIPPVMSRHLQSIDEHFETKRTIMISDLDSVSESLRSQMNQDFEESWAHFKNEQMTQEFQEPIETMTKQNLQDMESNSQKLLRTILNDLENRSQCLRRNFEIQCSTLTKMFSDKANTITKDFIQLSEDKQTKLEHTSNNTPTPDTTCESVEQVEAAKSSLTEFIKNGMNQLRSENGRLLKELQTAKTEALEEAETTKKTTMEAIDYYMENFYPGARKNIETSQSQRPHYTPPMTQPSMTQDTNTSPIDMTQRKEEQEPTYHPPRPTKTPIYGNVGDTMEERAKLFEERLNMKRNSAQ